MNYWGHFGISTRRGQYVLAVNHTFSIAGFQKHAEKKNLRPTMEHFFTVNTRRCCGWLPSCCCVVAKVFQTNDFLHLLCCYSARLLLTNPSHYDFLVSGSHFQWIFLICLIKKVRSFWKSKTIHCLMHYMVKFHTVLRVRGSFNLVTISI